MNPLLEHLTEAEKKMIYEVRKLKFKPRSEYQLDPKYPNLLFFFGHPPKHLIYNDTKQLFTEIHYNHVNGVQCDPMGFSVGMDGIDLGEPERKTINIEFLKLTLL